MSALLKSLLLVGLAIGTSAESQWCKVASDTSGKFLVASGYGCSVIYVSDDFGLTWKPTKAPSKYWSTVLSDSTGQHLIIGEHFTSTAGQGLDSVMYSLDRGVTWVAGTYNNEQANGVWLTNNKISSDSSAKHAVTVTDSRKLIQTKNGGASWFGVDNVPYNKTTGYNGYASVISGNGNLIYAVNDVGAIYLSKNSGTTYVQAQAACSDCGGEWHSFVTDSTGQYFFAATYGKFYASTNYGTTLTLVNDHTTGNIVDLWTDPAAKYVYVLCLDGLYTYTRSTGTFIKNTALPAIGVDQGYGALAVSASSTGQHIILSIQPQNRGLYISDDFGSSWTNIRGI